MLIGKVNLQFKFRMNFLTIVTIFGIFFVTILGNTYAEEDDYFVGNIELPFYYFYNYQNLIITS